MEQLAPPGFTTNDAAPARPKRHQLASVPTQCTTRGAGCAFALTCSGQNSAKLFASFIAAIPQSLSNRLVENAISKKKRGA